MNGRTELLKPAADMHRQRAPRELSFSCPECGGSDLRLQITKKDETLYVAEVYEDGRVIFCNLPEETNDHFYECADCGNSLRDDSGRCVGTDEDLVEWLMANRKQDAE